MDQIGTPELLLPGFRFHPTEEELVGYYLKKIIFGETFHSDVIGFVNIYHHDPCDLPGLAKVGEREWYFYVPRDRKHGHAGRPSRTTENGYWKATGSDRAIKSSKEPKMILGFRKTLVFYTGRAPRGHRTDWVMNEYRLPFTSTFSIKEDIVLCKVYQKATSLKVLEQRAAAEEVAYRVPHPHKTTFPYLQNTKDTLSSFCDLQKNHGMSLSQLQDIFQKAEEEENMAVIEKEWHNTFDSLSLSVGSMKEKLTENQLPKLSVEWPIDLMPGTQIRTPLMDNWNPLILPCDN